MLSATKVQYSQLCLPHFTIFKLIPHILFHLCHNDSCAKKKKSLFSMKHYTPFCIKCIMMCIIFKAMFVLWVKYQDSVLATGDTLSIFNFLHRSMHLGSA